MKVAKDKTESVITSYKPLRWKLITNDKIIEQVMCIDYLVTIITSNSRADVEIGPTDEVRKNRWMRE